MGPFLVVMQSSVKMPPWIQEDQSSEEAEGPETDSIPFQITEYVTYNIKLLEHNLQKPEAEF